MSEINHRAYIISIVAGLAMSFSFYARSLFDSNSALEFAFILKFVLRALFFAACICGLLLLSRRTASDTGFQSPIARYFSMRPKNIFILSAVMILIWIPIIRSMYPFHMGADTIAQLLWGQGYQAFDPSSKQILDGFSMSDHHPFLDTLIYTAFYKLGLLFSNETLGITILCYLTAIFTAFTFSTSCCWLYSHKAPFSLCIGAYLFWCLNPIISMTTQGLVKDMTSMPFFILWLLLFLDCALSNGSQINKPFIRFLNLGLLTLLCSLTRKTLFYVCIPSSILLTIYLLNCFRKSNVDGCSKRSILKIPAISTLSWLLPSLIYLMIIPSFVYPALKIAPGGVQETLSVPIQQVSSVVVNHVDELSSSELETISNVLPISEIGSIYSPDSADPVKDSWNRSASREDTISFLKLWMKLGLRYPMDYLTSIQYIGRFWTFGDFAGDNPGVWWGWSEMGGGMIFPSYAEGTQTLSQQATYSFLYNVLYSTPILGMLFDVAFYTVCIPITCCSIMIYNKEKLSKVLLNYCPMILSLCLLCIVAAYQPRYILNLLFCAPIFLCISFIRENCNRSQCEGSQN